MPDRPAQARGPRPPTSLSAGLATRPGAEVPLSPFARAVLDTVAAIPRGRVLSYGDVAELVGSGAARAVGAVLSRYGHEVAWQRVVRSDGTPNPASPAEAVRLLTRERTPMLPDRSRVDMARARWVPGGAR